MDQQLYDFRELDYILRDSISNIKSQIDLLCMSGLDGFAEVEKEEFYVRLQTKASAFYEKMNQNIVLKAKKQNELMKELVATQEALEEERNNLKARNRIIENDLLLARKIQQQILPTTPIHGRIAFLYQPMDQLGGDFFDITGEQPEKEVRFFLSDVSGHGITASLVTTMMKSLLTQFWVFNKSPSEIMILMNDALIKMIAGNFVTAFAGQINFETGKLIYCNAGHNDPFILANHSVVSLTEKMKSMPLGVMESSEQHICQKDYRTEETVLKKGQKLFLYTDGLTEAVPNGADENTEIPDYESSGLMDSLKKQKQLSPQLFLDAVLGDLVKFRHSTEFSDDISLICFEV